MKIENKKITNATIKNLYLLYYFSHIVTKCKQRHLEINNLGETDDSVDYDFDGGTGESWLR